MALLIEATFLSSFFLSGGLVLSLERPTGLPEENTFDIGVKLPKGTGNTITDHSGERGNVSVFNNKHSIFRTDNSHIRVKHLCGVDW